MSKIRVQSTLFWFNIILPLDFPCPDRFGREQELVKRGPISKTIEGNITRDYMKKCVDPVLIFVSLASGQRFNNRKINGMVSIQAEPTIKFAVGVFRHGIRAPYRFSYPNNPYEDFNKYFPEGPSQLTKVGKNLMYDVGGIFRTRYDKLLGDKYTSENVYFQSTAVERSIMSTEIMAQSIYPPRNYQIWRENLTWHPIPVWADYGVIDKVTLFLESNLSPRYSQLQKEAMMKLNSTDIRKLYKPLSDSTGRVLTEPEHLLWIYDNLCCQSLNHLQLPKWSEEFYPDALRNFGNRILKAWVADTPEMVNITSGTILHFVKNLLSAKANNTLKPNRKVYLHGGHDTSLVALLNGIGNDDPLETSPGATLVFELHKVDKQHIVKAFYLDVLNKDDRFREISIPLCRKPCTLTEFLVSIKSIDNKEWQKRYTS